MLTFDIQINAPRGKVWKVMLEPETYTVWTEPFMPGCYYEGNRDSGSKILFLGPGPEKSGMVSEIAENIPNEFISIRHLGYIKDWVEDTTSNEIKDRAPAYENYTFSEKDDSTIVTVDLITIIPWLEDYLTDTWPKALQKLKEICETR